jgi:hypothetical protein
MRVLRSSSLLRVAFLPFSLLLIAVAAAQELPPIGGPAFVTRPQSQTVFVGTTVTLTATASNSPTYQWFRNDVELPGRTGETLVLTNVQLADAGTYRSLARNVGGTAISADAVITVLPAPTGPAARISNASIRTTMDQGQTLIVGLTLRGGDKTVLLRAVGPGLARFEIPLFMARPKLSLFRGPTLLAENEAWGGTAALRATFARLGAFSLADDSRDAALERILDGGNTVQVFGTAGTVLVEAYDAEEGMTARIYNLSARNRVGTGSSVLIAGVTLQGTGPQPVLVRAIGPGLAGFGVPGVLARPRLQVFNSSQIRIADVTNWDPALTAAFNRTGAFALTPGSADAAVVLTLAPGSYTFQVSGADGGTGEALVELYEMPLL